MKKLHAFMVMTLLLPAAAHAERRCGWLDNPSMAKWLLIDAGGGWTIMDNGSGYKAAEGMDKIPHLTDSEFVYTYAAHGYACACMDVDTDGEEGITRIHSARQLPLSRCRNDPAIKWFLDKD